MGARSHGRPRSRFSGGVFAAIAFKSLTRAPSAARNAAAGLPCSASALTVGYLFLYHHPARRDEPMDIDFGVQVARIFDSEGNVQCVQTPTGEVEKTVPVSYTHLTLPTKRIV